MLPWLNGFTVSSGAPCQPTQAPSVLVIMGASAVTRPPGERRQPEPSSPCSPGAQRSTGRRLDTTMKSYSVAGELLSDPAPPSAFVSGLSRSGRCIAPPGVACGSLSTLTGRNLTCYSSVGQIEGILEGASSGVPPRLGELPRSGPHLSDRHEELMSPANEARKSKAERTAEAREKARQIREAQLKKDKRNKLLIGWGIVAAVVAILVVVGLVVSTSLQNNAPVADQGPTPANGNVHGGVTLLKGSEVAKTEPATVNVADLPEAPASPPATIKAPAAEAEAGKPVKVVLYIDFICPVCKDFEARYGETLTTLRDEGKISVEYRALGFLDTRSTT